MFRQYRFRIAEDYNSPGFTKQLRQIALGANPEANSLKEDLTTSVWRLEYCSRPLVVKRYNTLGLWHAIRRAFRRSRAENCWKMSQLFNQADIYTPPNVAVIQEWLGPFRLRSWYVCEYIEGELLMHYFESRQNHNTTRGLLPPLSADISQLFRNLRSHFLSHGDLKATNIIIADNRLCLIDLDAARSHSRPASFGRAYTKDLRRFMKNWRHIPEAHALFKPLLDLGPFAD